MPSLEYKKARILEVSAKLFMTYGYKRVSMEEIARNAGISKGTVYQLYKTKQELMFGTIDFVSEKMNSVVGNILNDAELPQIEKLQLFLKTISDTLLSLRLEALKDLEIDFPEAFEKIQQQRQNIIFGNLSELIRQGKQDGIYDPQINETLVAHVAIGAIDHVTQSNVIASFGCIPEQLFQSIIHIVLKGCLTQEYRDLIQ